jgi:small conductance mechanosensitive channel
MIFRLSLSVELTVFGIAYGDEVENFKNHKTNLSRMCILKNSIFIGLSADSPVNLLCVFGLIALITGVCFDMNEKCILNFYNLNIPFPQMDVHVQKNKMHNRQIFDTSHRFLDS